MTSDEYAGIFSSMAMSAKPCDEGVTTVTCGLKTYSRCKNKQAKVLVLGATLAFFGYFIHGFLNNFLDTDKLAVPVWSLAALIAAIDVYYADKEKFEEVE